MFQQWYCERCKASSSVRYKEHAGVTEVRDKIATHHRRKSPSCALYNGLESVRLGFRPNQNPEQRLVEPQK